MVVDGSRIPAPGISKSRLARPASIRPTTAAPRPAAAPLRASHRATPQSPTPTRTRLAPSASTSSIPSPSSSGSTNPAASASSLPGPPPHHHPHTPHRSTLPTARRAAPPARPSDPASRRTPRHHPHNHPTAPADRDDPPSAARRRAPGQHADASAPPASSTSTPRRPASKLRPVSRLPGPSPRLSSGHPPAASGHVPKRAARPSLPDRGHSAARAPSPRRRLLQESPYARRSSAGGPPATTTPQPSRLSQPTGLKTHYPRTSGPAAHAAPSVARRLNMLPADDDEPHAPPATAAVASVSAHAKLQARRASLPRNPDRPTAPAANVSTVRRASGPANGSPAPAPRRSSGSGVGASPAPRPRGVSALESFRAARRASLEGANGASAPAAPTPGITMGYDTAAPAPAPAPAPATTAAAAPLPGFPPSFHAPGGPTIIPVDPPAEPPLPLVPAPEPRRRTVELASGLNMKLAASASSSAAHASSLPDRADTPVARRQGARFSEANVCTVDVERLRTSLGRRRSVDLKDPIMPETPTLRRSSLGVMGGDDGMALTTAPSGTAHRESGLGRQQRSPLRSIFSNRENLVSENALIKKDSFGSDASGGAASAIGAGNAIVSSAPAQSKAKVQQQAKGGRTVPNWDEYDLETDMEEVEDLAADW